VGSRKCITKKLRFEVFKRDYFKCQYCGLSAPDVLLEIDHINPVSKNGKNDILNLITACRDCNRGKGADLLNENETFKKQMEQMKELQEKREQLKLLVKWRKELENIEKEKIKAIEDYWCEQTDFVFSKSGIMKIKNLLKLNSIETICDAIDIAIQKYSKFNKDGEISNIEVVFDYVFKITTNLRKDKNKPPYYKELCYIAGILKNRHAYYNFYKAITLLEKGYAAGITIEELKRFANETYNWSKFVDAIEESIELLSY